VVNNAETLETTDVNNEDEFEMFLSSQSSSVHSDNDNTNNNIKTILNSFKNIKREPYVSQVMQYWETEKLNKPELYRLACIVHAVPATQVRNIL